MIAELRAQNLKIKQDNRKATDLTEYEGIFKVEKQ